jgi:uncharacterized phage-like protein YoqJ
MIVAATGHRPDKLGGYSLDAYKKYYNIADKWLSNNIKDIEYVIVGGALGWDTAVWDACIDCEIPVWLAKPFPGQELKWPEESQKFYKHLQKFTTKVHIISTGPYAAYKMQVRNLWMVQRADLILAMWDGSEGGTYNCIKTAEKQNKPIVNLYNELIE